MMRSICLTGCFVLVGACGGGEPRSTIPGSVGGTTGGATAGTTSSDGPLAGSPTATTGSPTATTGSTPAGPRVVPSADGGNCESYTLGADRAAPDMLIVMDASGSMAGASFGGGGGGQVRWGPAVSAVNRVVGELEDTIQFGLMTFPNDAVGCAPGDVDVPMGLMNAQPIKGALGNTMPVLGNTPTSATLTAAGMALEAREPVLAGEFPLPKYIMLVTDGDPNCVDIQDPLTSILGGATGGGVDVGAQQASFEEVTRLAQANILTYVIGYDTASTAFAPLLDQMAVAGGTGDTAHRSVSNGDELLEEFRKITAGAVSCKFVLAQDVDFSRVNIQLDGVEAKHREDWILLDDMRTVELLGSTCEALQLGAMVQAEVVCKPVNLI